jgi:hypothetical protein
MLAEAAIVAAVALVVVAFVVHAYLLQQAAHNASREPTYLGSLPRERITVNGMEYRMLVAGTQSSMSAGLMNTTVDELDDLNVSGMIFVFGKAGIQCFWMKNTQIPLEQAWVANGTVTSTYNAIPYSTSSVCGYGNDVLEFPRTLVNVGDTVTAANQT